MFAILRSWSNYFNVFLILNGIVNGKCWLIIIIVIFED